MIPSSGDARGVRLVESLRWDGRLHRTERHLSRMERSADHLDFAFDAAEIRRRLSGLVSRLEGNRLRKVRITLGRDGDVQVEAVELEPLSEPVRALLVDVRTDPEDELLYHKTDRRQLYEEARGRASRRGFQEAVFRNTLGEVTEGSFTSLFVHAEDSWYTPPVSCGLLAGVYREVLLERLDSAEERVLRPADVAAADSVWLCNSVRGLKRARLTIPGDVITGDDIQGDD